MLLATTMLLAFTVLREHCAQLQCVQVVKGLRGGVQDVALKMLIGETHYQVNSFRQVHGVSCVWSQSTLLSEAIAHVCGLCATA